MVPYIHSVVALHARMDPKLGSRGHGDSLHDIFPREAAEEFSSGRLDSAFHFASDFRLLAANLLDFLLGADDFFLGYFKHVAQDVFSGNGGHAQNTLLGRAILFIFFQWHSTGFQEFPRKGDGRSNDHVAIAHNAVECAHLNGGEADLGGLVGLDGRRLLGLF